MPKEENFNPAVQNPEVGPVLPTVDPSVLAVPNQTIATPNAEIETVATTEPKVEEVVESAKSKVTTDKKSRKNKDKKSKVTKAEKTSGEQKAVDAASESHPVKPALYTAKLGHARNPFATVLVVISLIMSCVSLTYCIWDFIRSDVMAIIDHFNNSAVEEPAPEKTPAAPEAISITLDDTVYHGVAIIDQDPTSGVTILKFQNVDNLPFASDQQVVVINKPTAGDTIQLTILRDGKERTVNIILGSDKN